MSYLTDLQTIRDQVTANLKEITADPKPSYSVDGQTLQWADYFDKLIGKLEKIEAAIRRAAGPYEFRSRGFT